MTSRLLRVVVLLLMVLTRPAGAADNPPLEIGLLPNMSSRILFTQYQPLREYLEHAMRRPVQLSTAPDWSSFFQRSRRGDYTLTITAAHMARVHQLDSGLQPLIVFQPGIKALLVTDRDRPLQSIEDLRGRRLALSNPQSLVTLLGLQWLREQNLDAGRHFSTLTTPTDDSVGNLVLNGDCVAALVSGGELRAIPEALRARLQVFRQITDAPGFVALASPRLPVDEAARLKTALLEFSEQTDEGRRFFALTGFNGFQEASEQRLKPLDAFVQDTRRLFPAP